MEVKIHVRKDDYVVIDILLLCQLDDGPKFGGHGDSSRPNGPPSGPDRNTTACGRDSVGTTCDTTDNSANVSAKPPKWIVAERDFSGKHAGIEFCGTGYVWHQHVAFDGEPEYDEQSWNYAGGSPCGTLPGSAAGTAGLTNPATSNPGSNPATANPGAEPTATNSGIEVQQTQVRIQVWQIRIRRTRPATLRETSQTNPGASASTAGGTPCPPASLPPGTTSAPSSK